MDGNERSEVRAVLHEELALINQMIAAHGSYNFLTELDGHLTLTHRRVGHVITSFLPPAVT